MYFQIRSVVLWPRDSSFEPRVVSFEPGMTNVVMGGSRTGKSAIIPIIDYCLAARSCAIPKKVIRTSCAWFGIVVETKQGQKLFARREPGEQHTSDEMFSMEGREIQIPHSIGSLNAVTPDVLAAQHDLDQVMRELRRKQRDLERAQRASSRWEAEMAGQLGRARELGFAEPGVTDLSQEAMLALLRDVAKKTVEDFHADSTTVSQAVEELVRLEALESKLSNELANLKGRQSELTRLREGAGSYEEALVLQRDRLAISEWLVTQPLSEEGCPLCGSITATEQEKVEELRRNLEQIEASAGQVSELPAAVDREVQQLRRGVDELAQQLAGVRRQKRALTQSSTEAQQRQFGSLSAAHFLGQLSQALSLYDEVADDGELAAEIVVLKERAQLLSDRIDIE